jgi:hypothetical protein
MDEQQQQSKRPYPPPVFWRALLAFRNHAIIKLRDDYLVLDPDQWFTEGTFPNSVDVVDCYIDLALSEGWMDDNMEKPL